jgi:hypothetical protein
MTARRLAVLGLRPHTGWAVAVAVTSGKPVPVVLDRRKIFYEPPAGRFVYHGAAEQALAAAQSAIARDRSETERAAARELGELFAELEDRSISIAGAVIPTGNSKLPDDLEAVLSAHTRIHAAEGVFYRETLAAACESLGMGVHRPPERDLQSMAGARAGLSTADMARSLKQTGASLGPPWGEDQKLAFLAAWIYIDACAGRGKRSPRKRGSV